MLHIYSTLSRRAQVFLTPKFYVVKVDGKRVQFATTTQRAAAIEWANHLGA